MRKPAANQADGRAATSGLSVKASDDRARVQIEADRRAWRQWRSSVYARSLKQNPVKILYHREGAERLICRKDKDARRQDPSEYSGIEREDGNIFIAVGGIGIGCFTRR